MKAFSTLTDIFTPNNPAGLIVFGTLITLSVVNPFLGVLAIFLTFILSQAREYYGLLEACNIPVVKPSLFLGSEPNFHKTILHLADMKRFNKFGGIWGSYVGKQPQVYIADPELIRLIFVKDSAVHFANRLEVDLGTPMLNEFLDFMPVDKWKTIRNCLSPLFTASKIRQMSDVIADSASEFMDDLRSECDSKGRLKIDSRRRLTTWLIDMFAQSTLGIRMEDSKNPDNKFATAFRELTGEDQQHNLLFTLSLSFPFLSRFAPAFNDAPTKLIESTFRQVIEDRRKSGKKSTKDFLDVLCDLWNRVPSKEFQDFGITETTVVAQAVNFFLGGYETTTTALSHLLLHMAENPEVQEKMHSELMDAFARRSRNNKENSDKSGKNTKLEINHELIQDSEIPYILACINETLRLAPPAYRPERICTKDWQHKDISIKQGTVTILAAWPANRNPKVFPDEPDAFKPERFLPENKANLDSYALSSFDFGPRNCIGMRFGYESLKLFTCNLVKNFRVEKRHDTKLKYKPGSLLVLGFSPLYFDLVQRK